MQHGDETLEFEQDQNKEPWLIHNIHRKAEFYIAICALRSKKFFRKAYTQHSFVILGVKDKHSNNPILCTIGRGNVDSNSNKRLLRLSYSWFMMEEWIWFTKRKQEITYKAFSISEEQYFDFLKIIAESSSDKHNLCAYMPMQNSVANQTDFTEWQCYLLQPALEDEETEQSSRGKKIKTKAEMAVNPNYTCRHTTIELLDSILAPGQKGNDISALWCKSLPFTGHIHQGNTCDFLFCRHHLLLIYLKRNTKPYR
jgi:hypothetical protein